MVAILPVQTSANTGPQILRQRLRVTRDTSFSLRQFTGGCSTLQEISRFPGAPVPADYQRPLPAPAYWPMFHPAGNLPANPAPAAKPAPLTLRAAACICRKAFAAA